MTWIVSGDAGHCLSWWQLAWGRIWSLVHESWWKNWRDGDGKTSRRRDATWMWWGVERRWGEKIRCNGEIYAMAVRVEWRPRSNQQMARLWLFFWWSHPGSGRSATHMAFLIETMSHCYAVLGNTATYIFIAIGWGFDSLFRTFCGANLLCRSVLLCPLQHSCTSPIFILLVVHIQSAITASNTAPSDHNRPQWAYDCNCDQGQGRVQGSQGSTSVISLTCTPLEYCMVQC